MVLMWIIERRMWATILVGVPVFLAMLAGELWEHFWNMGMVCLTLVFLCKGPKHLPTTGVHPPTVEEILDLELELLANGSSLRETALTIPILLWWTPYSVQSNRFFQVQYLANHIEA